MPTSFRFAFRSLSRTPGFALVVAGCLALGIGVNVAFLRVIDVLMFRPPVGVAEPGALFRIEPEPADTAGQQVFVGLSLSRGDVERLAARRDAFSRVAAFLEGSDLSVGSGREARELDIGFVDGAYFGIVGARALRGRLLGAADDRPDAPRSIVLSERTWRAAYGADSTILGRRLRVNGEEAEIVGVVAGFTGTEASAMAAWMPLASASLTGYPPTMLRDPEARMFSALARLAPGVTREGAAELATRVLRSAPVQAGRMLGDGPRVANVSPVAQRFGGRMRSSQSPVPLWLLGATAAVLLVACANVANLLLVRGERRRRELATRAALGATRGALARQLLAESALLAALGGAAGLALAGAATRIFALMPDMPPLETTPDARTTLAAVAICALTTLLCGTLPALAGARARAEAVRSGTRATVRSPWRAALMVGQLAAALALMTAGATFVRSLWAVRDIDAGYDLAHLVVTSVDLAKAGMPEAERESFASAALERLRTLPRVRGVTRTAVTPFGGFIFGAVEAEGGRLPSLGPPGMQVVHYVGAGYFETLGLPVRRGRALSPADARAAEPVGVVSASFARLAWRGAEPIGRCVKVNKTPCVRIVGVAADAPLFSLVRDTAPVVLYRPQDATMRDGELNFILRAGGDPARTAREARAALQAMDSRLPFVASYALVDGPGLRGQLAPFRLAAMAFTAFGALALLVAAIGLYAVVAYGVARRTGEIGIRMALGATAAAIRRLVLGEGIRHALLGVVLGLVLGGGATWMLRSRLYGVQPWDPSSMAVVTGVLLIAALLASWLPARRAARIAPTVALRAD